MSYQLLALSDDAPPRQVGEYITYEAALLARIDDVIAQLQANDGWWIRADHVIVGPGVEGPQTRHELCTGLGVDPTLDRIPTQDDIDDARGWLRRTHEISVAET